AVIADDLLDSVLHQTGFSAQSVELVAMLRQRQHPIRNQVDGCLMTGHQQQEDHAHQLFTVEFVARIFCLYQCCDQILFRMTAACVNHLVEVHDKAEGCLLNGVQIRLEEQDM